MHAAIYRGCEDYYRVCKCETRQLSLFWLPNSTMPTHTHNHQTRVDARRNDPTNVKNYNSTVNITILMYYIYAVKRGACGDVCTTAHRMLYSLIDEGLMLKCDRMGSLWKTSSVDHRFASLFIGKFHSYPTLSTRNIQSPPYRLPKRDQR